MAKRVATKTDPSKTSFKHGISAHSQTISTFRLLFLCQCFLGEFNPGSHYPLCLVWTQSCLPSVAKEVPIPTSPVDSPHDRWDAMVTEDY